MKHLFEIFKNKIAREGLILTIARILSFILRSISYPFSRAYRSKKIFRRAKLRYSEEGFFSLNPMPSDEELDFYYSNIHWKENQNKKDIYINRRDLIHFEMIKKLLTEIFSSSNLNFINFGAGHGGISHLFSLQDFKITNIDPSPLNFIFPSRYLKSIVDVPDNSVDFFYSSHSLEHVNDINKFKIELKRILKKNGVVFFEVPNADFKKNGASNNHIDIPHTYYFQRKFFENLLSKEVHIDFYKSKFTHSDYYVDISTKNDGDVIRAIGYLNKHEK